MQYRAMAEVEIRSRLGSPDAAPLGPPIFIVGCGHSGTSLLLSVLDSHSNIHGIPFESCMAMGKNPRMDSWMAHFDRHTRLAGKNRWVEKTPGHIAYLDRILESAKDCRIIIMKRDGRDVACSVAKRIGSFETGIELRLKALDRAEPYGSHPAVMNLRYEDIVADFTGTMESVLAFIGESWEDGLSEFHRKTRNYYAPTAGQASAPPAVEHEAHRNWQINQPLFDGRGRWKRDMTEAQKSLFKERAGERLVAEGYAASLDW